MATQRATLANLDANGRLQQALIEQSSADIAATGAELARTKYDLDRYRALSNDHFASRQQFEQSDAAYEKARAGDLKARAALDAAQLKLDVIDTKAAGPGGSRPSHSVSRFGASQSWLDGNSFADRRRGRKPQRARWRICHGWATLLSIVPAHGLWVDANFEEGQLSHIRQGLPTQVVADVLPGLTFHGRVLSFAPATGAQFSVIPPENATGNFTKIINEAVYAPPIPAQPSRNANKRHCIHLMSSDNPKMSFVMRIAQAPQRL
jgi:membrane fusion protein, multidrug efflux system